MIARFTRINLILRGIALMSRRERWQAAGIIFLMVVTGLLESSVVALVVPLVYVIIDPTKFSEGAIGERLSVILGQPIDTLFPWIATAFIFLLVASYTLNIITIYAGARHNASCRDRMAAELLRLVTAAPYLWLLKQPVAILKRHVHDDVFAWRNDFLQALLQVVQSLILIVTSSAVAIAIAPLSGFSALALVAVVSAIIVIVFRKKIRTAAAQAKITNDKVLRHLLQILQGLREIRVSGRVEYFTCIFSRYYELYSKSIVATRIYGVVPAITISLLGQIGFVVTAMLLWWRGGTGAEITAQLALVGVVVSRVVPAANSISTHLTFIYSAAPFVESLVEFRDSLLRLEQRDDRFSGKRLPASWRTLSMKGVSFRYPESNEVSLSGVDLLLHRGRFYGFVGRSGAGKSTLVNLLLGLIDPTEGQVMVDNMPLNEISTEDWHRRFGYVPQDAFILDASLRDNVAFGEPADDAAVLVALERARLGPVVRALKSGLDTELGERGRRFSGGQAQRVAIARALFKGCEVMLLDEATSALDSITEFEIHESLEPLRGQVMALIIAHRVSTLRHCDRIFVLESGQIVDEGTYAELLERSHSFRMLAAAEPTELADREMAK